MYVYIKASNQIELLRKLLGKIRSEASNQIEFLRKMLGMY